MKLMKLITNILLVATIICYVFLPFYELSFEGSWTGLTFTSETITHIESLTAKLFSIIPFIACFGGIFFNCMKSRYWNYVAALFIFSGIYFYHVTQDFTVIEIPKLFSIISLGYGFHIGSVLLYVAFISTLLSIFPFSFMNSQKQNKK